MHLVANINTESLHQAINENMGFSSNMKLFIMVLGAMSVMT